MKADAGKTLDIQPDKPFAVSVGTWPVAIAKVVLPLRSILHPEDGEDTLGRAAVAFNPFLSEIGTHRDRTGQKGVAILTVDNHKAKIGLVDDDKVLCWQSFDGNENENE